MSLIKSYTIGLMFSAALMVQGCSTVPKCSDPESVKLIEDIFYDQFKVSEDTKLTMKKYLKLNLTAARLTSVNEDIGKNSCSGNLSIAFEPVKLKSLADRFVFKSNMDKFMGYPRVTPSFELQDYQADIHYDIQNTEKDGLYGSVLGLKELVEKVDLLVFEGVFNNSREISFRKIGVSKHDNEMFFDANNIVDFENYTQMLHMINWKEYGDKKASQVEVNQFYCKTDGKFKIINREYYTEHNGKGNLTGGKDDFEDVFYTVKPTTEYEYLWEVACEKKLVFKEAEIQQIAPTPIEPNEPKPTETKPEDLPVNAMQHVNEQSAIPASQESNDLKAYTETITKALAASADAKPEVNNKCNFETSGNSVFEIINLEKNSATVIFRGWPGSSSREPQCFDVQAQSGQDVRLEGVRKMISLIRERYKGDFNWSSGRLNRAIMMSARPEDSAKLEEFIMIEYFGENYKTEM